MQEKDQVFYLLIRHCSLMTNKKGKGKTFWISVSVNSGQRPVHSEWERAVWK